MGLQSCVFSNNYDVQLRPFLYDDLKRTTHDSQRTCAFKDSRNDFISILQHSVLLDNRSLELWSFQFIHCFHQIKDDWAIKKHDPAFFDWETLTWWKQSRPTQFSSILHFGLLNVLLHSAICYGIVNLCERIPFHSWIDFATEYRLLWNNLEVVSLQ